MHHKLWPKRVCFEQFYSSVANLSAPSLTKLTSDQQIYFKLTIDHRIYFSDLDEWLHPALELMSAFIVLFVTISISCVFLVILVIICKHNKWASLWNYCPQRLISSQSITQSDFNWPSKFWGQKGNWLYPKTKAAVPLNSLSKEGLRLASCHFHFGTGQWGGKNPPITFFLQK